MRNLLVPLALTAFLGASAMAFAAPQTATDAIKTLDSKAQTLTLNNGQVYHFPAGFKDPGLKVGERVAVTYDASGAMAAPAKSGMAAKTTGAMGAAAAPQNATKIDIVK